MNNKLRSTKAVWEFEISFYTAKARVMGPRRLREGTAHALCSYVKRGQYLIVSARRWIMLYVAKLPRVQDFPILLCCRRSCWLQELFVTGLPTDVAAIQNRLSGTRFGAWLIKFKKSSPHQTTQGKYVFRRFNFVHTNLELCCCRMSAWPYGYLNISVPTILLFVYLSAIPFENLESVK